MADKVEKPKKSKAKPKKDEKGVLAALPSTRPQRIGTRRASAPKTFEKPEAAKTAARATKSAGARKSTAAKKPATAKKSATGATATRRKAAAPRTFEPTSAAESAAGAADERAAGVATAPPEQRPRAVREGAPGMGTSAERTAGAERRRAPAPAGRGDEPRRGEATSGDERSEADEAVSPEHGRPSGVELVTTAVQAAGELTQIGLTIGGQIVKRAVDRLPRP
jgi:hypothetical protein